MDQLPTRTFEPVQLCVRNATGEYETRAGVLLLAHWEILFYSKASYHALQSMEKRKGSDSDGEAYYIELVFRDFRLWLLRFPLERLLVDLLQSIPRYASPKEPLRLPSLVGNTPAFTHVLPYDVTSEDLAWAKGLYEADMARILDGQEGRWTLCGANVDFSLCSSYPRTLALPRTFPVHTLRDVADHRAHSRFPVLTWLHPLNGAALCRSAQPQPGLAGRRSPADEMLVRALLTGPNGGAIIDARPYSSAVANRAISGGYEDAAHYGAEVDFLGIENIHHVRDSLERLRRLVRGTDTQGQFLASLNATQWPQHVHTLLKGAVKMARHLSGGRSVLVHCSHGWDRTAQLSALAQLLLDPHYRTLRGFCALVDKEWCAFGHQCSLRAGHILSLQTLSGGSVEGLANEEAPIFIQFIDAVAQILMQCPTAFEFTDALLIRLVDAYYSCTYSTFLANNDSERAAMAAVLEPAPSLWSALVAAMAKESDIVNSLYVPTKASAKVAPLKVSAGLDKWRLWEDLYLRHAWVLHPSRAQQQRAQIRALLTKNGRTEKK